MDGHIFEYFCAEVLSLNGFSDVEVTQGSRDQGVDIIAYKDDIKYGIQCKCYSSDIGNKAVQEVYAGKNFYNCESQAHYSFCCLSKGQSRPTVHFHDNPTAILYFHKLCQ